MPDVDLHKYYSEARLMSVTGFFNKLVINQKIYCILYLRVDISCGVEAKVINTLLYYFICLETYTRVGVGSLILDENPV